MSIKKGAGRSSAWTAALASTACLLAVGAASAANAMATQQLPVSYRDLDLSTPAGARVLYIRIERAAHEVCGFPDQADLHLARASRQCYSVAVEHAVSDVHSPLLTALYNKNRPRLTAMALD
jgi:UrcA family protein